MVVESRRRNFGMSMQTNKCEIIDYLKMSLLLDPLPLATLTPSVFQIILYGLFLTIQICIFLTVSRVIEGSKIELFGIFAAFFVVVEASIFLSAYIYYSFMGSRISIPYLSHTYATAFSLSYLPLGLFIGFLNEKIGIIFILGAGILSQYYIRSCYIDLVSFANDKEAFLFSLITFVLQYLICIVIFYTKNVV